MSRRYFVFDASALAFRYLPFKDPESQAIKRRLEQLFVSRARDPKIVFQVPSVCMAECSKAFARSCYEANLFGSGQKAKTGYLRLRDSLLQDVQKDRIIHSCELRREHFEDIEGIFVKDYELPIPRGSNEKRLSPNDALIISTAVWMAREWAEGLDQVKIVTAETRMARFCNAYRSSFPQAVNVRRDDLPGF